MDISNIKIELGLRIKSFRNEKNITQEKFSSIIGIEQSNLSNIENGKTSPDITTLFSILQNTEIEPNYLLGFLAKNNQKFNSIDFEILNLLLNMPYDTKVYLTKFLKGISNI